MSSSKDKPDNSALAIQLASTQSLIQGLLKEMRDNSVAQASLKSDLKGLRYNVSMLSNIIRGGEGGVRSVLTEVELLKKATGDLEEQVGDLTIAMAKKIDDGLQGLSAQFDNIQRKIAQDERDRRTAETAKMELQQRDVSDRRLDRRARFATLATIIIAILALAGSVFALLAGKGK